MEFNPDDFGKRNEDEFVTELLAHGKCPIFLLPFRIFPNATTEQLMNDFIDWLLVRGANVTDDRVVFVLANYDTPPEKVLGPTNTIESAINTTLVRCGKLVTEQG